MKVTARHMLAIDTGMHMVFSTEDGKLGHIRIPIATNLLGNLDVAEIVPDYTSNNSASKIIAKLLGREVEVTYSEDDWYNVQDEKGLVRHPFTQEMVAWKDLKLDYSNYLDKNWQRWFPETQSWQVSHIEFLISNTEEWLKSVKSQMNDIVSKDYSEEKLKYDSDRRTS